MKLVEPMLSDLDRSWTDEDERIALAEGTPPAFPPPPSVFPTASVMLPAPRALMPTARPVVKRRDHNDSTLIVRPRRDTLRPTSRRAWLYAGVAGALVAAGTMLIALWPTGLEQPPPAAARVAATVAPATTPVAPPVVAKPVKHVATATPAKKPKPVAKRTAKPATKVAAKPKAKPVAKPAVKPVAKKPAKPRR